MVLPHSDAPLCDTGTWAIIKSFAQTDDAALSVVENELKDHLGTRYKFGDWKLAFYAALAAVNNLEINTLCEFQLSNAPVNLVEGDLMQAVNKLKSRKQIVGTVPTLKDLLNPIQEIGESSYCFDGSDKEIITVALAPEIVGVESDSDGSGKREDEDLSLLYKEALTVKTRVLSLVLRWRIRWYVRVYQSRDETGSYVYTRS